MLRSRTPRTRRTLVGLALATSLALSSCTLGAVGSPTELGSIGSTQRTRHTLTVEDADEIRVLMRRRATAVLAGDRQAFLATVDDRDRSAYREQRTYFDNLAQLPVTDLSYYVSASGRTPEDLPGDDPVVRPYMVEHLEMDGVLDRRASVRTAITFVRRDGAWLVGHEAIDEPAPVRPWFGGPISVARTDGLLVVTDRGARPDGATIGSDVADDLAFVVDALGREPRGSVVLDATSNGVVEQVSEASGVEAAAVTTTVLSGNRDYSAITGAAATAVKINPGLVDEIIEDRVVMRHELTHLVLRAYSGRVPTWMSEGIAEYVASPQTVAEDRASGYAAAIDLSGRLPELVDTGSWGYDPAGDYLIARATVEYLVERYGLEQFFALLDDVVSAGEPDTEEATDRALRRVYGERTASVERAVFATLEG